MEPCQSARQSLNNWGSDSNRDTERDRFIPRQYLLQIFNKDRVLHVLLCHQGDCNSCKRDYRFIRSGRGNITIRPKRQLDRILPDGRQAADLTTSAIALLALLVKIGHPLLIIPLLEAGRNDSNTLDSYCGGLFQFPRIREEFWNECSHNDDPNHEYSKEVANLIRENISIFFRPIFRDENFHTIPDLVELPFYRERPIGEGSYGKVTTFRIFEGHNKFQVRASYTKKNLQSLS